MSSPDTTGTFRDAIYTYDRYGLTTNITDPAGGTTDSSYDMDLRLIRTKEPDGDIASYSYYNKSNELQTSTDGVDETGRRGANTANGDTIYTIDERNEKRRAGNQDFVATIYVRDSVGNTTSEQINRYTAGTSLDQNPLPAPAAVLRKVSYTYDAAGNVASLTDPNGNVTYFSYQAGTGNLTKIDGPPGNGEGSRRVTTIEYNPDGSQRQVVDPKGR